jgi:hypothetical protein
MTLTFFDLCFVSGAGLFLAGCWMAGNPSGMAGTGVVICVLSVVMFRAMHSRRGKRK